MGGEICTVNKCLGSEPKYKSGRSLRDSFILSWWRRVWRNLWAPVGKCRAGWGRGESAHPYIDWCWIFILQRGHKEGYSFTFWLQGVPSLWQEAELWTLEWYYKNTIEYERGKGWDLCFMEMQKMLKVGCHLGASCLKKGGRILSRENNTG